MVQVRAVLGWRVHESHHGHIRRNRQRRTCAPAVLELISSRKDCGDATRDLVVTLCSRVQSCVQRGYKRKCVWRGYK